MVSFKHLLCLGVLSVTGLSCAHLSGIPASAPQTRFLSDRTEQVVQVTSSGPDIFQATLTAWQKENGVWRRVLGPWPAVVGRNGFAPAGEKREGDGRTPSGVYALATAFGRAPDVRTGLDYRQAREGDIWVDDAASPDYNHWTTLPTQAASFEKMLRTDGLYDLGVVIEYNTDPVIKGGGSAIFLHIWREKGRKPTAGCVALEQEHVRRILAWLQKTSAPVMILGMP